MSATPKPPAKPPADLTRDESESLRELVADTDTIAKRIEADAATITANRKKIAALVNKSRAYMIAHDKTERTRYGIGWRITTKPGRVAWRSIVEQLKGKAFADKTAADAKPTQACEYTL